jgi:hypothetical protein
MMAGNAQRTNTPTHSCVATDGATLSVVRSPVLTFKNRASYIQDGRTATLQMLHFIYFFNKYKY